MAEHHIQRALMIYGSMGDPWGLLESRLLSAQLLLAQHRTEEAKELLAECATIQVEEAEPRQHFLLTRAWLEHESGDLEKAFESIEAASEVFGARTRAGDHTPHLLSRLARLQWPRLARERIDAWRSVLTDRARRNQQ